MQSVSLEQIHRTTFVDGLFDNVVPHRFQSIAAVK